MMPPSIVLKAEMMMMHKSICQLEMTKNQRAPPKRQPVNEDKNKLFFSDEVTV